MLVAMAVAWHVILAICSCLGELGDTKAIASHISTSISEAYLAGFFGS